MNSQPQKANNEPQTTVPPVETDGDGWNEKRIDTIGPNGNDGLHYEEIEK